MDKELEITIKPDGTMSVETININGAESCNKVIETVLMGVGGNDAVSDIKKKDEYWKDNRKVFTDLL